VSKQNQDGNVISQNPRAGSTARKGSTVTIVVGQYRGNSTTTTTTPSTTTSTTTTSTTG
jgi:beta-lactam-binding protein with PASTA domain